MCLQSRLEACRTHCTAAVQCLAAPFYKHKLLQRNPSTTTAISSTESSMDLFHKSSRIDRCRYTLAEIIFPRNYGDHRLPSVVVLLILHNLWKGLAAFVLWSWHYNGKHSKYFTLKLRQDKPLVH